MAVETVTEAAEPTDFSEDARSGNALKVYAETARRRGDGLAIEMGGWTISHVELLERARRFAGGLAALGLEPGDRVLVYLPNCPEYLIGSLGALSAGTPASPANPQYKARELGYQLEDSDAAAVLTHVALRERVAETLAETGRDPHVVVATAGTDAGAGDLPDGDLHFDDVDGEPTTVEVESEDVALQPYTSGTTGRPKGVLVTHENLRAQAFAGLSDEVEPHEDRSLTILPLYHITGYTHCSWQPLVRGGAVFLRNPADWDAEELMRTIEEHDITTFIGVAAMYVDLVNHEAFGDYDLSSLVVANEGGAKMPVAVQEQFEDTTGIVVEEGYGLTETTGATHNSANTTFGPRVGMVGQPMRMTDSKVVDEDGNEVPIGEEGEILVRGPQVMKGYHDRPEANEEVFTEDGYFRTGDVGRRDAQNYYEIVDRKKHVIVTAGYNVYPSEVEALLYEHEAVADVAVVGIPDERRNETVHAYVIPAPGVEPSAELGEELKQYCLDNLAEYKHPREVEFVQELPRTASGKVQKFKLSGGEREVEDEVDASGGAGERGGADDTEGGDG